MARFKELLDKNMVGGLRGLSAGSNHAWLPVHITFRCVISQEEFTNIHSGKKRARFKRVVEIQGRLFVGWVCVWGRGGGGGRLLTHCPF
jgi:hypothetical protein